MLTSFCPVICTSRLGESRDFYTRLFGFEVGHETEWCVGLGRPGPPPCGLVLLDHTHPALPEAQRRPVRTVRFTLEVGGGERELEHIVRGVSSVACRRDTGPPRHVPAPRGPWSHPTAVARGDLAERGAAGARGPKGSDLIVIDPNGVRIHVVAAG